MSSALVLRADLWTVPIMELAHITVFTLKMPVSAAVLQVCLAEHDGARAVYCMLHEPVVLHEPCLWCDTTYLTFPQGSVIMVS